MAAPTADYREVARFEASLDAFVGATRGELDELVRQVGFTVAENVIVGGAYSPGTPVDVGFARNSWAVGLNEIPAPRQAPENSSPEQPVAVTSDADAAAVIAQARLGDTIILASNCAYMEPLEEGHSQQAPNGMIKLAVQAGQLIVDDEARRLGLLGGPT